MGKPTVQQVAGLDILDLLYFNQMLVRVVMGRDALDWLVDIVERVKMAVAATGAAGVEAEIMKHYALCFLEIYASDESEDPEAAKFHRHNKTFFCALLDAIRRVSGNDSLSEAVGIADALVNYVLSAPAVVRIRLAERCLAVEYRTSAHECFRWLVEAEAIPCAKFRDADIYQNTLHMNVVARIGLLCEFEGMRLYFREVHKKTALAQFRFDSIANTLPMDAKQLITEARDLWVEKHFGPFSRAFPRSFDVGRQSEKDYVVDYLKRIHPHWSRQRFFGGTSAGWVSNLGALEIMILKSIGDPRPIYIEENKNSADTLAEVAKKTMQCYGMTIHARSLYMCYRKFTTTILPRMTAYCEAIKIGPGVFLAEEEEPFYKAMLAFPWDTADAKEARCVEPEARDHEQQNSEVNGNAATASVIANTT